MSNPATITKIVVVGILILGLSILGAIAFAPDTALEIKKELVMILNTLISGLVGFLGHAAIANHVVGNNSPTDPPDAP